MDTKIRRSIEFSIFGRDYRYAGASPQVWRLRLNRNHALLGAGIAFGVAVFSAFMPADDAAALRSDASFTTPDQSTEFAIALPQAPVDTNFSDTPATPASAPAAILDQVHSPAVVEASSSESGLRWKTVQVKNGDTLAGIAKRVGLSPQDLHQIVTLSADTKRLAKIFPGDNLEFGFDGQDAIQKLRYAYSNTDTLEVQRVESGFSSEITHVPLTREQRFAAGTITSSLFLAAQDAGLSDRLTMEFAGVFGWDVDFALDIREGDSFAVLYEELYKDGERVSDGNIIAAEFINRGETFRAVRYTPEDGRTDYFTPDGHSLRKTFLRTPVEFSRISSGFSLGRKHPILNRIRAHKGVDYAAPTGTPVRATGDGKVVTRGITGGYGKTIVLQHGSQYSTLYAHLSSYARGVANGSRVRQGQVIGYVGQTGLATGPHLHYEFRVNGAHRNPLKVKFPDAEPLAKQHMAAFTAHANPLLAALDGYKATKVALDSTRQQ